MCRPCARIRGGGGLYAAPARGSVGRRPPCEEEGRTPREEAAALRHRACGSEGRGRRRALSSVMREGEQRGREGEGERSGDGRWLLRGGVGLHGAI